MTTALAPRGASPDGPEVSVVMCVFNGLPFLAQAIESILTQTFTEFEFIVVDDASTDGSWEVLSSCSARDERLVLLRNETNLGYGQSQNRALRHARGRFIALMDQDDVSLPRRLSRQVDFLTTHPETGVVGVRPELVDEAGKPLPTPSFLLSTDNRSLQQRLLETNCFCGPSVMTRRASLDVAGGYDPDLRSAEDYDLLLRLAEVTQLANLPDSLYLYRQHARSVSQTRRYEQIRNKAVALEKAMQRRYANRIPGSRKCLIARDGLRAAYLGFMVGETEGARTALGMATRYAPTLFDRGNLVEQVIGQYVLRQRIHDPFEHVEAVFSGLLPPTHHMRGTKTRLLAQLHMRAVFEQLATGEAAGVGAHLWPAIRDDPRWLLNRGVLAIAARELLA